MCCIFFEIRCQSYESYIEESYRSCQAALEEERVQIDGVIAAIGNLRDIFNAVIKPYDALEVSMSFSPWFCFMDNNLISHLTWSYSKRFSHNRIIIRSWTQILRLISVTLWTSHCTRLWFLVLRNTDSMNLILSQVVRCLPTVTSLAAYVTHCTIAFRLIGNVITGNIASNHIKRYAYIPSAVYAQIQSSIFTSFVFAYLRVRKVCCVYSPCTLQSSKE